MKIGTDKLGIIFDTYELRQGVGSRAVLNIGSLQAGVGLKLYTRTRQKFFWRKKEVRADRTLYQWQMGPLMSGLSIPRKALA